MDLNEPVEVFELSMNSDAEPKAAYPTVKNIVKLFFLFLLYNIIFGIIYGACLILFDTYGVKSPLLKSLASLILYAATQSCTIRYAIKKSKSSGGDIFRIRFNNVPIWLMPAIIIAATALFVLLNWVSDFIPVPVSVQKFFAEMFTKDFFSIVTLVIAAPILEEILCRGIILRGLLKNYAPPYAILISATFFAILHMNPWQAVPAFFGGLFMGWAYYKTKSVIPGIIIHATNNSIAALLLFFPEYEKDPLTVFGSFYYILLLVLSVLVFSITCLIIQKRISTVSEASD